MQNTNKDQYLGIPALGQLESEHIECNAILAGSITDFGYVVGRLKTGATDTISLVSNANTIPIGISCPTITINPKNVPVSVHVYLFRNKQAVAIRTSDATVTYGGDVFVDNVGMATQTVTSGWKIGICADPNVRNDGLGFAQGGFAYMLVEMRDPIFAGGA